MGTTFRSNRLIGWAMAGILLLAGCASAPSAPETMRDAEAAFSAYRTFAWYPGAGTSAPGKPQSIVDGYIRTAITNEMQRKGYALATEGGKADLLIEYEAAAEEKLKSKPFRIGIGIGGYGSSGGASVGTSTSGVKEVKEGSLVIHVVDPARNAEVWRGSVARELKDGTVEQGAVNDAVTEAFADFPARTAPP